MPDAPLDATLYPGLPLAASIGGASMGDPVVVVRTEDEPHTEHEPHTEQTVTTVGQGHSEEIGGAVGGAITGAVVGTVENDDKGTIVQTTTRT